MQCPNLGLQIQNHSQSLNDGLGDQVGSVVGVQPVTADNASTALIDIKMFGGPGCKKQCCILRKCQ